MSEIESYVRALFRDVPDSVRKELLQQEIVQNLSEKMTDLMAEGMSDVDAIEKAVRDFGDAGDLRDELADSARMEKVGKFRLSFAYSVWGAVLVAALMLFINLYNTPQHIWFVYPVLAIVWWPMTLYFLWRRAKTGQPIGFAYSVCGFAWFAGLILFINFYLTPQVLWFIYPIFAAIWWPLSMLYYSLRQKSRRGGIFND